MSQSLRRRVDALKVHRSPSLEFWDGLPGAVDLYASDAAPGLHLTADELDSRAALGHATVVVFVDDTPRTLARLAEVEP